MFRIFVLGAILGLFLIAGAITAQQQKYTISGVIVDEQGNPLPEAEIARWWRWEGQYTAQDGLKADSEGKFKGELQLYRLPALLTAFDKDRKLGATLLLTQQNLRDSLRVVLKPLGTVVYQAEFEGGRQPESMSISFGDPKYGVVLWSPEVGPVSLPEGQYQVSFFSIAEFEPLAKSFEVKAGERTDLGILRLKLAPIAKNIGKPAMPITFAEARGVPRKFKLSDLKGKWVMLEFWGFW